MFRIRSADPLIDTYNQFESALNETSSRRDDDDVVLHYFKEEQRGNRPFSALPFGRENFGNLLRCSSLTYRQGTRHSSHLESFSKFSP